MKFCREVTGNLGEPWEGLTGDGTMCGILCDECSCFMLCDK